MIKMKKISLLLVIIMVVAIFSSCQGNNLQPSKDDSQTTESSLPDVKIAIDSASISDPETFISDMEKYGAEVQDMTAAGGGYIFVFSAEEHKKLLADKQASIVEKFKSYESDEESYVEKIEYTDNFRDLVIYVNRDLYDSTSATFVNYSIGANALVYQLYLGEGQHTFVKIIYSDNEETAETFNLPMNIESVQ